MLRDAVAGEVRDAPVGVVAGGGERCEQRAERLAGGALAREVGDVLDEDEIRAAGADEVREGDEQGGCARRRVFASFCAG